MDLAGLFCATTLCVLCSGFVVAVTVLAVVFSVLLLLPVLTSGDCTFWGFTAATLTTLSPVWLELFTVGFSTTGFCFDISATKGAASGETGFADIPFVDT